MDELDKRGEEQLLGELRETDEENVWMVPSVSAGLQPNEHRYCIVLGVRK